MFVLYVCMHMMNSMNDLTCLLCYVHAHSLTQSTMAHPTVFWLSSKDRIEARVTLGPPLQAQAPPTNVACTFTDRHLSLTAHGTNDAPYALNIELFAEVHMSILHLSLSHSTTAPCIHEYMYSCMHTY
jgi:hypothetical protein